jgi:hypothetical protein
VNIPVQTNGLERSSREKEQDEEKRIADVLSSIMRKVGA